MRRLNPQQQRRLVDQQRAWIDQHGGCLSAYIERYGSADDPVHHGDGGEAIYAADMAALRKYESGFI